MCVEKWKMCDGENVRSRVQNSRLDEIQAPTSQRSKCATEIQTKLQNCRTYDNDNYNDSDNSDGNGDGGARKKRTRIRRRRVCVCVCV